MKKLAMMLCFSLLLLSGKAQDLVSDFLQKQPDAEEFTQVNVSPKMFQLLSNIADEETEGIIRNLTGMRIVVAETDVDKHFALLKSMIGKRKGYEELMTVKEEAEKVEMYIRENNGSVSELVILVANGEEFVLMNFTGKIDLKKIAQLTQVIPVEGMEYLDKVKGASRKNKESR